jgi:hypothetical protein
LTVLTVDATREDSEDTRQGHHRVRLSDTNELNDEPSPDATREGRTPSYKRT